MGVRSLVDAIEQKRLRKGDPADFRRRGLHHRRHPHALGLLKIS
jgi:hypothetical protein